MKIIIVSLLLGVLFIVNFLRVEHIKSRRRTNKTQYADKKREWMRALQEVDRFELEGYEGETKDRLQQVVMEANQVMEELFEKTGHSYLQELEKRVEEVLAANDELKKELISCVRNWRDIQKEMEDVIEYATAFFVGTNFFPAEFINEVHRLERMVSEIKEEKRQNPLSDQSAYRNEIESVKKQFATFELLHREVAALIEQITEQKEILSQETQDQLLLEKQHLYLCLQAGQFEESEQKLRAIREMLQ